MPDYRQTGGGLAITTREHGLTELADWVHPIANGTNRHVTERSYGVEGCERVQTPPFDTLNTATHIVPMSFG
ncbi:MAG: hypothetical protein KKD28_07890, partial [Chloroflexi bacterium]|nr:hypothetical protein [Chloroflexota bacterium]